MERGEYYLSHRIKSKHLKVQTMQLLKSLHVNLNWMIVQGTLGNGDIQYCNIMCGHISRIMDNTMFCHFNCSLVESSPWHDAILEVGRSASLLNGRFCQVLQTNCR